MFNVQPVTRKTGYITFSVNKFWKSLPIFARYTTSVVQYSWVSLFFMKHHTFSMMDRSGLQVGQQNGALCCPAEICRAVPEDARCLDAACWSKTCMILSGLTVLWQVYSSPRLYFQIHRQCGELEAQRPCADGAGFRVPPSGASWR